MDEDLRRSTLVSGRSSDGGNSPRSRPSDTSVGTGDPSLIAQRGGKPLAVRVDSPATSGSQYPRPPRTPGFSRLVSVKHVYSPAWGGSGFKEFPGAVSRVDDSPPPHGTPRLRSSMASLVGSSVGSVGGPVSPLKPVPTDFMKPEATDGIGVANVQRIMSALGDQDDSIIDALNHQRRQRRHRRVRSVAVVAAARACVVGYGPAGLHDALSRTTNLAFPQRQQRTAKSLSHQLSTHNMITNPATVSPSDDEKQGSAAHERTASR